MKTVWIFVVSILVGGLSYATFSLLSTNALLEEQLQTAMSYQQQLQEQAEENTLQRLDFETQLADLQDQLLTTTSQLSNLSIALEEARQRIDPDYEQLLEQARQELAASQPVARRASGPFAMFSDPNLTRSMAEDRTSGLFGDYLDELGVSSAERDTIEDALVEFADNRYQMMGQLLSGELSAEQAAAVFGANGMVNSLSNILTDDQSSQLSDYDLVIREEALRQMYSNVIPNSGSALTGSTQDLVLDVLMEELFSEANNYGALVGADGSMTTAVGDRVDAYTRARSRLENDLDGDQLAQFDQLVESQSNSVNVVLDAIPDENGQTAIRNMRVSVDNLPN